jgi:two-component system, OmpR family, sensor histidine kinase VanS
VLAFLLVFGLVGGWVLAGRMLAPLTRITGATRLAATGSLSHRIRLPGRRDEFRELADAFDTMLARLEAHVAEQQRFAANASHDCAPRWRSRRHSSTWPATIKTAATTNWSTASTPSTPEPSTSPKHCCCSAAPTSGPSPREHVDLSLVAEEATETLLALAEKHGATIETSGAITPPSGRTVSCCR